MTEIHSAARAAIFSRIREANSTINAAMRTAGYQNIQREYQQSASMSRETIVRTFAERLHEYDANVYESTPTAVSSIIAQLLAAYGQRSAIVAKDVPREWLPKDLNWKKEAEASIGDFDKAEDAIIVCETAIAHTGTIVLRDSRRLSLLPDRLLCVVRERQIVETVPEAIKRLQPFAADALTFISGPSATADIEMTRIRGVHGPRILDIIIVRD